MSQKMGQAYLIFSHGFSDLKRVYLLIEIRLLLNVEIRLLLNNITPRKFKNAKEYYSGCFMCIH